MADRVAALEDPVTVVRCVECDAVATGTADGWKAYIAGGIDGEPLEVVIYCGSCAIREVGVDF